MLDNVESRYSVVVPSTITFHLSFSLFSSELTEVSLHFAIAHVHLGTYVLGAFVFCSHTALSLTTKPHQDRQSKFEEQEHPTLWCRATRTSLTCRRRRQRRARRDGAICERPPTRNCRNSAPAETEKVLRKTGFLEKQSHTTQPSQCGAMLKFHQVSHCLVSCLPLFLCRASHFQYLRLLQSPTHTTKNSHSFPRSIWGLGGGGTQPRLPRRVSRILAGVTSLPISLKSLTYLPPEASRTSLRKPHVHLRESDTCAVQSLTDVPWRG